MSKNKNIIQKQEKLDIQNSAILDYLEIIKNEYSIEREKRQSFETRANLIMTILAAICVFIFDKVKILELLMNLDKPMYITSAIKLIIVLTIYIVFIYTIIKTIKSINVAKYGNFKFDNITDELLKEDRIIANYRIYKTYVSLLTEHRKINDVKAKNLKKALISLTILFISLMIYIIL